MDFIWVQMLDVNAHIAKGKFLLSHIRSVRKYYYRGIWIFYGFARFRRH
jgi:hypothetical protein